MKEADKTQLFDLGIRYSLLILAGISNLFIFYFIFKPLTIYPVYFILNLFLEVRLIGNVLLFSNFFSVQLINACIAGAAYYLLLILNLSTPNIKMDKRISMIFYSFLSLLVLNVIRIIILTLMFLFGFTFFEFTHQLFWYVLSFVFVIAIWFIQVKIYNIKGIPFFSDLKYLYNKSSLR